MLDFLFNGVEMINAWTKLLVVVGIIGLIALILWISFKTKTFAPFMKIFSKVMAVVLFVALMFSGVYSYLYVGSYYKEDGGIYGRLSKVVYNSIESVNGENEEITYNFENLVFKENDGKYSIVFVQQYKNNEHRTRFQNGEKYSIFVHNNGEDYECNYIQYDTEWIIAQYSYVFYNSHDETDVIGDDTLSFDFCFYENYSYLKITSDADYTTIQLWEAYFKKYNFTVSIKVVDDVYVPTEFQNNVIDGFVQITYVIDETVMPKKELYPVSNEVIELPTKYVEDGFYIYGWTDKDGNEITSISKIKSSNITIYAKSRLTTSLYTVNFYNVRGTEIVDTKYYEFNDIDLNYDWTDKLDEIFEEHVDQTFLYWTIEQVDPINGIGGDWSSYPEIATIEDLIMNFPAGTSEFNLYPLFQTYF